MQEVISKEIFDEIAQTGRIGLDPAEAEALRAEMNRQMSVIAQLEAIPLDAGTRPVVHSNPYPERTRQTLREDVPAAFPDVPQILAEVPQTRDGFIVSPDIPHQKIG